MVAGSIATTPRPGPGPTVEELTRLGREAGLAAIGVASAAVQQPARDVLNVRKRAGLAGEMKFTYRNPDRSSDPRSVLPSARSVIAGAWGYGDWDVADASVASDGRVGAEGTVVLDGAQAGGRVARYVWRDHHRDLLDALEVVAAPLRAAGFRAVVMADSNHLVDRNAAWSAGLGWYGKNANLLLPDAGSWFILGSVVTDAELPPTGPPRPDGCGSCARCIDDCPTGAIIAPGVVDATRCLAWLVQAGGWLPRRWRVAVGDRLYGCDICQEVCPPNHAVRRHPARGGGQAAARSTVDPDLATVDLDWLLSASDDEVLARHGRWYIADRDVDNVRRTALVVLGNVGHPDRPGLVALLRRYLAHPDPRLRGHAVWAAKRLGLGQLAAGAAADPTPEVREEAAADVEARFEPERWSAALDGSVAGSADHLDGAIEPGEGGGRTGA